MYPAFWHRFQFAFTATDHYLRALPDPAHSVTVANGATDAAGFATALGWWVVRFPIAAACFVVLFRIHRGTAAAAADGEGY